MSSQEEKNLFAKLATTLLKVEPSAELKLNVFERVSEAIDGPPAGGQTVRAHTTEWQQLTNEVAVKVLHIEESENIQTALWRLAPGGRIPPHTHAHNEECLVLDGQFHIGTHVLDTGDFHVMNAGSRHPELTSPEGCLLYIRQGITRDLAWIAQR